MNKTLGALFCLLAFGAQADGLTPEQFVAADVEARELTLAGMQTQADLLVQGADEQSLLSADVLSAQQVEALFASYDTSGAAHTAYGTQQRAAIEQWLAEQPDWQSRYQDLDRRFEDLSSILDALRQGN